VLCKFIYRNVDSNLAQNFEFKVELSTVAISSDNNLLIAGTIDGQVLLQEIKTSDKAVQRTVVGQGEAIVALISLVGLRTNIW
jgi:hypothetical protein